MFLYINKAWGYGDANADHYFMALNYRISELQAGTHPPVVVDPNQPSVPASDPAAANAGGTPFVQVPVIPEECR